MRRLVTLMILGCLVSEAHGQHGPLDLIPKDAAAAVAIRNLNELRKKGDDFIAAAGLRVPLRPSELFDQLYNALGIQGGVDYDASAAVVLLAPKEARSIGLQDLEENLLGLLPFADLDKLAGSFGLEKGQLKLGMISEGKGQVFGKYFAVRGKHLMLANSRSAIERYLNAKSVLGDLVEQQQRSLKPADLFIHIGSSVWREESQYFKRQLERSLGPDDSTTGRAFIDCIDDLRYLLVGARVEKGVGISALAVFDKEKKRAAEFLAGLRSGLKSSDLAALPEGRVVFAQSAAGDGSKNVVLARMFFTMLLKSFIETQQLFSPSDYPSFLGVFTEVWQRLRGTRSALYLTSNEQKLGLFSMIAILESENPQMFIKEMRLLARMAQGKGINLTREKGDAEVDIAKLIKELGDANFRVRSSANTKLRLIGEPALPYLKETITNPPDLETQRRAEQLRAQIEQVASERRRELLGKDVPRKLHPSFVFHEKPETRNGQAIDIVELRLGAKELPAVSSMQQLLGPDWDKIRIAIHGKKLVALVGSEVELLDAAIDNLKNTRPGLASSRVFSSFQQQANSSRAVEFHASLNALMTLVGAKKELPPLRPAESLTSFAVTVETDRMQLDLWIPVSDLRMIAKSTFGF